VRQIQLNYTVNDTVQYNTLKLVQHCNSTRRFMDAVRKLLHCTT